jgi:hypothetical protein
MIHLIGFLANPNLINLDSFLGGIPQTLEGIGGLSVLALLYHSVSCHQTGCRRIGRFPHGHLRLCKIHHPLVPDDGVITAEHIAAIEP